MQPGRSLCWPSRHPVPMPSCRSSPRCRSRSRTKLLLAVESAFDKAPLSMDTRASNIARYCCDVPFPHNSPHGLFIGRELLQIVDAQPFFERRNPVEVDFESFAAERLMINLSKLFAQSLVFLPGDD